MEAHEDIDKAIERSLWGSVEQCLLPEGNLQRGWESADWCMSQRCGIWAFAESVRGLFKVWCHQEFPLKISSPCLAFGIYCQPLSPAANLVMGMFNATHQGAFSCACAAIQLPRGCGVLVWGVAAGGKGMGEGMRASTEEG
eukprot:5064157-Pyramimonas_sp.AAC.1